MQTTSMTHRSIVSLAKTTIVAAIYVVMTLMLSPLSFGIVQVRFSEMLNYTALFNRRYVWAVTLGVFGQFSLASRHSRRSHRHNRHLGLHPAQSLAR